MLNDVEFREINELGKIDRVKIVACDAKSSTLTQQRYEDNWLDNRAYINRYRRFKI